MLREVRMICSKGRQGKRNMLERYRDRASLEENENSEVYQSSLDCRWTLAGVTKLERLSRE